MNRLVRRCLKALFFVLHFSTRYLYFFISFSLWSISFWFHCLFFSIVHIMSQKHALGIKTESVSVFSMRRFPNRMEQREKSNSETFWFFQRFIVAFVNVSWCASAENSMLLLMLVGFLFLFDQPKWNSLQQCVILCMCECARFVSILAFIFRNNRKFFPRLPLFAIVSVCLFVYAFRLFRCFQLDIECDKRKRKEPPYKWNDGIVLRKFHKDNSRIILMYVCLCEPMCNTCEWIYFWGLARI